MANKTFKVLTDKMGGRSATDYVGAEGDVFYDPTSTTLRMSDGSTPGGTALPLAAAVGNTITVPVNETLTIRTSYSGVPTSPPTPANGQFVFAHSGTLYLNGIRSANSTTTVSVYSQNTVFVTSNERVNITAGNTVMVDATRLILSGNVPSTSVGSAGDTAGMYASDLNYIYRCVADYDGTANIWKRVALTGGAW